MNTHARYRGFQYLLKMTSKTIFTTMHINRMSPSSFVNYLYLRLYVLRIMLRLFVRIIRVHAV